MRLRRDFERVGPVLGADKLTGMFVGTRMR